MMVVWFHGLFVIPGLFKLFPFDPFASGVDIFFVISGFIMTVTTAGKTLTPAAFFAHRVVRVVPLYWAATILAVAVSHWVPASSFGSPRFSLLHCAQSMLFVPYDSPIYPGRPFPLLPPGWTLNYEMFFYAVFALSLMAAERWRLVLLAVLFVSLASLGKILSPSVGAGSVYTDFRLLEFVSGMAIATLWLKGNLGQWYSGSLTPWIGAAGIAAGAALLTFGSPMSLLIGATLIVGGSLTPWMQRIKCRLLLEIGNASYSIYLSHLFTLDALHAVWKPFVPQSTVAGYAFMIVAMTACAAAGWCCYRLVEKPMTSWLHSLLNGARSTRSVTQRLTAKSKPLADREVAG